MLYHITHIKDAEFRYYFRKIQNKKISFSYTAFLKIPCLSKNIKMLSLCYQYELRVVINTPVHTSTPVHTHTHI